MKNKKLFWMVTVAVGMFLCAGVVYARGGGGGGFRGGGGGGWSGGGRGGGGFEGRGERPGEHGSGEYHGGGQWDHGDGHRRNNNNNDNNNNNNYYVNGWGPGWGYGAGDDALAGMAMGTMMGAAMAQPSTVVVEQPAVQQAPPLGAQVTVLPAGCTAQNVSGTMAYQCGPVWYRPFFGSSGVYYQAVPPPPPAPGPASADQVVS